MRLKGRRERKKYGRKRKREKKREIEAIKAINEDLKTKLHEIDRKGGTKVVDMLEWEPEIEKDLYPEKETRFDCNTMNIYDKEFLVIREAFRGRRMPLRSEVCPQEGIETLDPQMIPGT